MCQMSIIFEENGEEKTVLENVTLLETDGDKITVSALFEEPEIIPSAYVKKIDFMGGKVTLAPVGEKS